MWRRLGWLAGVGVVAAGLLGQAGPAALADEPAVADQAPPPNLVCSGRRLPALSLERSGASGGYSCRVVGAAADETSFTLRASVVHADGSPGELLDPFCSGNLDDGTGVCSGVVFDAGNTRAPVLTVSGTVLPSGRSLEPTTVVAGFLPRPLPPEMLPPAQN